MKLTWFGGTTVRVHIGGEILVVDAAGAPAGIDAAELVSGADRVITSGAAAFPVLDALAWKPRPVPRLIDAEVPADRVQVFSLDGGALLIDAVGEPPLVLILADLPQELGRWAQNAVFVMFGHELREHTEAIAQGIAPKLIVLAGDGDDVDLTFNALEQRLSGVGLVALETGMALEV